MELSYAIARYEQALELLPVRWQQAARRLPDWRKAQAEEFRLRTGRPMTVLTCEGEILVSDELPRALVTQSDLEQLCDMVTGYSRYAVSETLSKGYLIGRGGFRVGVCGTAVLRDGANTNLRDISSVAVRISRQVRGLAEPLLRELWEPEGFPSTLLLAPPGVGKTTLLRDMICALSDGDEQRPACRVGIVDERGELAAMYRGVPQLEVGAHTDVLDGCPKALGITKLLRSANPQVIAVDEITAEEDTGHAVRRTLRRGAAGHHPRREQGGAGAEAAVCQTAGDAGIPKDSDHHRGGWTPRLSGGGAVTAKLAGAALIVAGAVWCCAARRRRQRQRLTLAQALAQALSAMETGIRWQRQPMPQLLAQLAQRPMCGTYFDTVREMLQSDMPLQIAWNRTFSRIPDAETAEVLRRMELGGDETRLLTQLEDARQALTTLAARWAREDAQDRRVAGALALSAAGLLVILLI